MPSFFTSMPKAATTLLKGLTAPKTYQAIFKEIDRSQVILVTGEEDNTFTPSGPKPDPNAGAWTGLTKAATVASGKSVAYETPVLPAGKYLAQTTQDAKRPGGDVDLYVRVGSAPTLETFDYRRRFALLSLGASDQVIVVRRACALLAGRGRTGFTLVS